MSGRERPRTAMAAPPGSLRRHCFLARLFCAALVAALSWFNVIVPSAHAAPPAQAKVPAIVALSPGFDGAFKIGFWNSVALKVTGGDGDAQATVRLTLSDGDGAACRLESEPFELLSGQVQTVTLYARLFPADITAQLFVAGKLADSKTFVREEVFRNAASPNQEFYLSLGEPLAPTLDPATMNDPRRRAAVVTPVKDWQALPRDWLGYDGVDALLFSALDAQSLGDLSQNDDRIAALYQWVQRGGRLVICCGENAEKLFGALAPLARFAPGRIDGALALRRFDSLEAYAASAEAVSAPAQSRLSVPKLTEVEGRIEAYEGSRSRELPLVVRTPRGFGEVVFAAFDLAGPPLNQWNGRSLLVDKLLARDTRGAKELEVVATGQVTTLGYTDLAGQLRSALDQFSGVTLVSFWIVAALIILYILCIGPLDYFFLSKVVRRMEATWVTFTLVVLLFSAAAAGLAYRLKGTELRANQIEVVDTDVASGFVRGSAWASLLSPRHQQYDLTFALDASSTNPAPNSPGDAAPDEANGGQPTFLVSALAAPESGLNAAGSDVGGVYQLSPTADAVQGMPIAIWSTKGISGRWTRHAAAQLEADLSDAGDHLLAGSVQSDLDFALTDCVLIYDRWAYPLRVLPAHGRITLSDRVDPSTVETYLRHPVGAGERIAPRPYDRAALDAPRILEMMMFYDLAGGQTYTGLLNRQQSRLDFSGLIRAGRAVLVGRSDKPAARLMRDGKPLVDQQADHWTIYRFVLPVKQNPEL